MVMLSERYSRFSRPGRLFSSVAMKPERHNFKRKSSYELKSCANL